MSVETDVKRLDRALEVWEQWKGYIWSALPNRAWEEIARGLSVAKAYRDLLANGQRVEWCHYHASSMSGQGSVPAELKVCDYGYAEDDGEACEPVVKLLSVYPKEAEK